MRCNNCQKFIPDVSTTCPYCNTKVDPNAKPVVDFGDLDDINYGNDKFDIKVYIKEPKNKKIVIPAIILIILVVIIFIGLILSLFINHSEPDYQVFTKVVEKVSTYLEDNYLLNKTGSSGKYKLTAKVNKEYAGFNGNYAYDVKSRIISLNGMMKDPKEQTGEVLIDTKDFEFNLYMKDNNMYFQSDEIYGTPYIFLPIEDTTGLLTTKNYDLYSLVIGSKDALTSTLKQMNYETTDTNITYLGKSTSVTKRSLVLDNKNKLKFISTLLTNLIDDANFINELARIRDEKSEEIIKTLENYITTSEYKYSSNTNNKTTISIYYDKVKVYRIEVDSEENKLRYQLDIGENKYYLEYFKDNQSKYVLTLATTKKELENLNEKTYDITYKRDDLDIDISIFLEEDKQPKVKKQEIKEFKNIKEFTDEDYFKISSNASYYLNDVSFINKIREYTKEKCTVGLNCICNEGEDICKCNYEDTIIECPKAKVTSLPPLG